MLKRSIIQLIEKYQNRGGGKVLFGIDCNYSPSCSEYMKICINENGLLGIYKGISRILRYQGITISCLVYFVKCFAEH